MRTIWIAIAIMVLLILGAAGNSLIMQSFVVEAVAQVETALDAAEIADDAAAALPALDALTRAIDARRIYLASVLPHVSLEDVEEALTDCRSDAEAGDVVALCAAARQLLLRLEHIGELESLQVWNIL